MGKYVQFLNSFDRIQTFFFLKSGLRGQNCSHERAEPGYQGKTIDVNSVLDAKPDGYILKLHYTSIGIKNSGVLLSSAKDEDEFSRSPRYDISMIKSYFPGINYNFDTLFFSNFRYSLRKSYR